MTRTTRDRRNWTRSSLLVRGLAAVGLAAALLATEVPAQAEIIPLANGRVMHGEIMHGTTGEDGLAVKLFDTGGTVIVKWDHILASRAKSMRIEYGIDIEEEESVTITGHELILSNGSKVRGVLLDPGNRSGPHQLKTTRSVREFSGEQVAAIKEIEIDLSLVYTSREAYQIKYDEAPPELAAEHFDLAVYSTRIRDFEKAKEHFEAAWADENFRETPDGNSLPKRIENAETLVAAGDARILVDKIKLSMSRGDWNQARDTFFELRDTYKGQDKILKAVRAESLEQQVARGRRRHFLKQVPLRIHRTMLKMVTAKARERKPTRLDPDADPLAATQGTLNAARQWTAKDLPAELWDKVAGDLGLEKEEVDEYWNDRTKQKPHRAHYGTGSFIVIKKATPKANRRRRAPGSERGGRSGRGSSKQPKKREEAKPKTEEEWWTAVRPSDKAQWLKAHFAETSGLFEIIRVDESEQCSHCGGLGFMTSESSGGGSEQAFCQQCNGSGAFRKVVYK